MRTDYERAVAAERARNAPRDPYSGSYGRSSTQLVRLVLREVQAAPIWSLVVANLVGLALGAALAAWLRGAGRPRIR